MTSWLRKNVNTSFITDRNGFPQNAATNSLKRMLDVDSRDTSGNGIQRVARPAERTTSARLDSLRSNGKEEASSVFEAKRTTASALRIHSARRG